MTASEVAAASEIHVVGMEPENGPATEPATDAPAGGRSKGQLAQMVRWAIAALAVNLVATAIWVLSTHANRMNLNSVEAMRLVSTNE